MTDSSAIITTREPAYFFHERFIMRLLDTRKDAKKKNDRVCKGLSNDDVGVSRGSVSQETRPRSYYENGDFV